MRIHERSNPVDNRFTRLGEADLALRLGDSDDLAPLKAAFDSCAPRGNFRE